MVYLFLVIGFRNAVFTGTRMLLRPLAVLCGHVSVAMCFRAMHGLEVHVIRHALALLQRGIYRSRRSPARILVRAQAVNRCGGAQGDRATRVKHLLTALESDSLLSKAFF
jgi:hypothetical protein